MESVQTCGDDPRGGRVEWRNGGGRTRLVGVTELGRMMGTDPNLAVSMLDGLGRCDAGKSAGGMDVQRKGWVRVQDRARETNSSSSSSSTRSGVRTPPPPPRPPTPPKAPKKKPHFQSSEEAPPPRSLGALGEGDDGDDGDDEGDEGGDKGEGGGKGGEIGDDKERKKEGDTGGEKGGAGSKDEPQHPPPPHAGGVTCVSRLANGGLEGQGG